MQITFTRHIFSTLTYRRDDDLSFTWKRSSRDFNRYIQKLSRLHNLRINYLRVVEEHTDGYPHIHCILQYPSACIRVENSRYFDTALYQKWRTLWSHGHSDYQKPRVSGIGTLSYVMKYLLKNQTSKTVWKKVLSQSALTVGKPSVDQTTSNKCSNTIQDITRRELIGDTLKDLTKYPTHKYNVKLCTWSRNFDFSYFYPKTS